MFELFEPSSWKPAIQQAQADDFWIFALMALAFAAASAYGIFHFIRRARIIEDTPTSRIRSAHQGYVELIGRGQYYADQPLSAPLTGTACTWYQYEIAKKVRSGKNTHWKTIDKEISEVPLMLVDDTGQCLINPQGAEVIPSVNVVWYGHSRHPERNPRRHNSFPGIQLLGGRYRYTEQRMHAGDPLYALGHFTTLDGNSSIAEETREVLKKWKQKQAALLKHFDENRDGEIDSDEWVAVRDAAEQLVVRRKLTDAGQGGQHVLGKTGQRSRPFILSVQPQHAMSRKFRIKAFFSLLAFILLGPASVWAIAIRLGW